ncbi:MAG: PorV/PorQ family protein [Calditrichaeota bacterium]|nr:PorV/PorQ family protein [Calditrichota bacterium]
MKKTFLLLTVYFIFTGSLLAQNLFPLLGGQRVGTSVATFLKIDIGAEATAMAGSYIAIANDATTLYWNPAGADQVDGNSFTISHIEWPVDIQYDYAGFIYHFGDLGSFGISLGMLHMPDMEVTTEYHPTGTGAYFRYYDSFAALTYSKKLTDQFSFGTSIKFVEEGLDDLKMRGVMVDLGTFYWTGFRDLRFAVSLSNFGPDMKPDGSYYADNTEGTQIKKEYESFSPPTIFRVGAAMGIFNTDEYDITTSFQINHPVDNAENAVAGLDFGYMKHLHLRAGYRINYDEENFTFGAGFLIPVKPVSINLGYAYKSFLNLGATHQFTLDFKF